jgi:hypothetical protein
MRTHTTTTKIETETDETASWVARARARIYLLEDRDRRAWMEDESAQKQMRAEIAKTLGVDDEWVSFAHAGVHQPRVDDAPSLGDYIARLRATLIANIRDDQARHSADMRAYAEGVRAARKAKRPTPPKRVQPYRRVRGVMRATRSVGW